MAGYTRKCDMNEVVAEIQRNPAQTRERREAIARQFGITGERVRQIWMKAYHQGRVPVSPNFGFKIGSEKFKWAGGVLPKDQVKTDEKGVMPVVETISNQVGCADEDVMTDIMIEALMARRELPVVKANLVKAAKERDQAMDLAKGLEIQLKEVQTRKLRNALQQGVFDKD